MSILQQGTLCVIVGGCPENIGMIVAVIQHLGRIRGREDAYHIRTVSGRHFHQMWKGADLIRGHSDNCVTDQYKLRSLVEPGVTSNVVDSEITVGCSDR